MEKFLDISLKITEYMKFIAEWFKIESFGFSAFYEYIAILETVWLSLRRKEKKQMGKCKVISIANQKGRHW